MHGGRRGALHHDLLMEQITRPDILLFDKQRKETSMARALILWLMGVPLFVVLLLWYFFF